MCVCVRVCVQSVCVCARTNSVIVYMYGSCCRYCISQNVIRIVVYGMYAYVCEGVGGYL